MATVINKMMKNTTKNYRFIMLTVMSCVVLVGKSFGAVKGPTTSNPGLKYWYPLPALEKPETITTDICVYGGTPGGVGAAVQAQRMGKKAVLAVFRRHVGGLTSSGLTAVDLGVKESIGGMAAEFLNRMGQWNNFTSSAAESGFRDMLNDSGARVLYEHRLKRVEKTGNRITALVFENGNRIVAQMFVDATYEGDLLALAGVSYHVGREANSVYNETVNGFQISHHHQFQFDVDPYRKPGDPSSGLLPGMLPGPVPETGTGDKQAQAYCFRMWATTSPQRIPFPYPANYNRDEYALLLRYITTKPDFKWSWSYASGPLKLNEGDCNNAGPVSLDYLGNNWDWPEADYATRERIFQEHVRYQQGLMWFLANDPEVPAEMRAKVNKYGLPGNEFMDTGGWPHELYVREGRRMISDHVMTEADCLRQRIANDSVGLASYSMDSHNCSRYVVNGVVKAQGDVYKRVPTPYPVSYKSIIPKEAECGNLLVPVAVSSSHMAFGSIRMEPVFMILGQSAGTAAVLAMEGKVVVQKIDYEKLKEQLLKDGQILEFKKSKRQPEHRIGAAAGA